MANDELRHQTGEERTTKPKHQAGQKARQLLRELETQKKKEAPRIRSKRKKSSLFARHVSQNGGRRDDVAHCGEFLFYFLL